MTKMKKLLGPNVKPLIITSKNTVSKSHFLPSNTYLQLQDSKGNLHLTWCCSSWSPLQSCPPDSEMSAAISKPVRKENNTGPHYLGPRPWEKHCSSVTLSSSRNPPTPNLFHSSAEWKVRRWIHKIWVILGHTIFQESERQQWDS